MALGAILREERERRGLTDRQVAEATRMMVQMVRELEQEDFHRIAAPIYGRGFVKLYAAFLEIDPEPLVKDFERLYAQRNQKPAPQPHVPLQRFGEGAASGLEVVEPSPSTPASGSEEVILRIPATQHARTSAPAKDAAVSDLFGEPLPPAPNHEAEEPVLTVSRNPVLQPSRSRTAGSGLPASESGRHSVLDGASRRFEGRPFRPGPGRVLGAWLGRILSVVAKGVALVAIAVVSGFRRVGAWLRLARLSARSLPWPRIGRIAALVLPVLLLLWGAAWGFRACARRHAALQNEVAGLESAVVVERILPPPPGYAD